jgi:hypothetical protein
MSIATKKVQKKSKSAHSVFRKQENSKSSLNKQNSSAQDILTLHQTIGNQAVQRLFESGFIQGKLIIGKPNDKYEQEADRVADEVMRMPEPQVQRQSEEDEEEEMIQPKSIGEQITPLIQRQVEPEEEEEETLQAKAEGQTPDVIPSLESRINALQGGGQSLSKETKNFFEPRFEHDFSGVRIHTDSNANQLARGINARAFTRGNNVVFGGGEYIPGSSRGKRLLGHELTHVVQQSHITRLQRQVDPRHIRGYAGEQGLAFNLYRLEDGWAVIRGPGGSAGHGITASGEDGLFYNVRTHELHIADNKSFARKGRVSSATAIDPSKNLLQNLNDMIKHVESKSLQELPMRQRVLKLLRQTRASIRNGRTIPGRVKLVVGNAGGQSTGITTRLKRLGVTFIDVNKPVVPRPGTKRVPLGSPQPSPKPSQFPESSSTSKQRPIHTRSMSTSTGKKIPSRTLPPVKITKSGKVKITSKGGWALAGKIGTTAKYGLAIWGAINSIDSAVQRIEKAQTGSVRPEVAQAMKLFRAKYLKDETKEIWKNEISFDSDKNFPKAKKWLYRYGVQTLITKNRKDLEIMGDHIGNIRNYAWDLEKIEIEYDKRRKEIAPLLVEVKMRTRALYDISEEILKYIPHMPSDTAQTILFDVYLTFYDAAGDLGQLESMISVQHWSYDQGHKKTRKEHVEAVKLFNYWAKGYAIIWKKVSGHTVSETSINM